MLSKLQFPRFNSTTYLVLFLALFLSACANKNREYKSNSTRYFVNSVSVFAADPRGDEFAKQLQFGLANSIGSPSRNYAREVRVLVQVLPSGIGDQSLLSLARQVSTLGGASATASVRVLDDKTGESLEYKVLTATSTRDDPQAAFIYVEEDLIAQIRALLGLNLVPPHPVANFNQNRVYFPGQSPTYPNGSNPSYSDAAQTDENFIPTPSPMSADPLLNGQITPETTVQDLMKKTDDVDKAMTAEAIEMKKTVIDQSEDLSVETPVEQPVENFVEENSMQKETVKDEPMASESMDNDASSEDDDGELCIVTVENDCLVPNIDSQ